MAITGGKIYRPDDDGIIWINNGMRAISRNFQTMGNTGDSAEGPIPVLMEKKVDIQEIVRNFHGATGGFEAETMIGWSIASLFSDDIFKEFRSFPDFVCLWENVNQGKPRQCAGIHVFWQRRKRIYSFPDNYPKFYYQGFGAQGQLGNVV